MSGSNRSPKFTPIPYYSFDRVAAEYEATRYLPPSVADALARQVTAHVSPGDWILDAGVGTGRVARALAAKHPRTAGVDISRAMMQQLSSLPFLAQADIRALPFKDEAFHRVLTVHVLHLIADWQQAVAEMWRVLAPGGSLFLGWENRERAQVREYFLLLAEERSALAPTIGAHSSQVLSFLREEFGAKVMEFRGVPELTWERSLTARETLDLLTRRTYSLLWATPDETLSALARDTERWVLREFGSLEYEETIRTEMVVYAAAKRK